MDDCKPTVLLVEDNEEDAFLLRRALRMENVECNLHVAQDGQEAVDYLGGNGSFADRRRFPLPVLVLLDLKLPFLNGFEVLEWLRAQPDRKDLRVVILTSSGEDCDRDRAKQLGVQTYFVKPPTRELALAVTGLLQELGASAPDRA